MQNPAHYRRSRLYRETPAKFPHFTTGKFYVNVLGLTYPFCLETPIISSNGIGMVICVDIDLLVDSATDLSYAF